VPEDASGVASPRACAAPTCPIPRFHTAPCPTVPRNGSTPPRVRQAERKDLIDLLIETGNEDSAEKSAGFPEEVAHQYFGQLLDAVRPFPSTPVPCRLPVRGRCGPGAASARVGALGALSLEAAAFLMLLKGG
jgi:hypothetical protein